MNHCKNLEFREKKRDINRRGTHRKYAYCTRLNTFIRCSEKCERSKCYDPDQKV